MIKIKTGIFLFLMMSVVSQPSFADVKKWKDENGVTHYGDAPMISGAAKVHAPVSVVEHDQNADSRSSERKTSSEVTAPPAADCSRFDPNDLLQDMQRIKCENAKARH